MHLAAEETDHLSAKELHPSTTPHRLRRTVDVAEEDVRLPAHLLGFERGDVQHGSVGGKEHVQLSSKIFFLESLGKILNVERLVGGEFGGVVEGGVGGCGDGHVGWLCMVGEGGQ